MLNIVGDHATGHVAFESPLKPDLAGIAQSVSHWVRSSQTAAEVGADGTAAVQSTRDGAVGRIATLVLPADTAWGASGLTARAAAPMAPPAAPPAAVDAAAHTLRALGPHAVLLLSAAGSQDERAQRLAAAIAAKTGCRVLAEFYNARMAGGLGRPAIARLPCAVDATAAVLAGTQALVLAGSVEPIGFFAHPCNTSQLKPASAALLTGRRQPACPACCLTKECYPSGCCRSGSLSKSSTVEGCGHVVEGGGGGQRSRAAARCPRSPPVRRRRIVHMSMACRARSARAPRCDVFFGCGFRLQRASHQARSGDPEPFPSLALRATP